LRARGRAEAHSCKHTFPFRAVTVAVAHGKLARRRRFGTVSYYSSGSSGAATTSAPDHRCEGRARSPPRRPSTPPRNRVHPASAAATEVPNHGGAGDSPARVRVPRKARTPGLWPFTSGVTGGFVPRRGRVGHARPQHSGLVGAGHASPSRRVPLVVREEIARSKT
jgi:hypothetical protein